jgi:4-hydroxy-4-methyl-2-oxoglutarate aldolase
VVTIGERVEGVTPALRALYDGVQASTVGHFTDFGFVRGLQPLFRPVDLIGNAVTVRIPHLDGSVIRQALLASQPGDVLVIDVSGDDQRACWGERRTLAALTKGLAGVVIGGAVTDVRAVTALRFPVFSAGISALTTRSLALEGEVNTPVVVGGVAVHPGDLVLGDDDGLVILDPARALALGRLARDKQHSDTISDFACDRSGVPRSGG